MSDAYENFQEGRQRLSKGLPAQARVFGADLGREGLERKRRLDEVGSLLAR